MSDPTITVIGCVEIVETDERTYKWRCTAGRDRSIGASPDKERVIAAATRHANRCLA